MQTTIKSAVSGAEGTKTSITCRPVLLPYMKLLQTRAKFLILKDVFNYWDKTNSTKLFFCIEKKGLDQICCCNFFRLIS